MNPFLLRSIIYPTYRLIKHDKLNRLISECESSQWLSRDELAALQWEKLIRLIAHAWATVPYYKELFDRIGLKPWSINSPDDLLRIPILTKDIIRRNLEDLVSRDIPRSKIHKDSTGGSTGEPVWYYVDDQATQARRAMVFRGDAWAGARLGDRQATLWGAAFDIQPYRKLSGRIKAGVLNTLFLSSYDLSRERLQQYAEILEKFEPKLLTSYPTPLVTLAEFLLETRKWEVKPGAIIASSETLFDHQRRLIEEAFGCAVFNRYGSREFGAIAHECGEHSGLHMNSERVFVEFMKENGAPSATGESGEMLITDLDNYGMPFIRYRIDDVGIPTDRACKCGRGLPLIERVEGRVFDVVVTPSGARFPGTFWTLLSREVPGIMKFQVVQDEPSSVTFQIVPGPDFREQFLEKLDRLIGQHTGGGLKVNYKLVDAIPLTRTGKHRFIISNIGR